MRIKSLVRFSVLHPNKFRNIIAAKLGAAEQGVAPFLVEQYLDLSNVGLQPSLPLTKPKKIIWLVPPIAMGGGGATTISRFVKHFQNLGLPQEIQVYSWGIVDLDEQKNAWRFLGISRNINVREFSKKPSSDVIISTAWQTYVPGIVIGLRDRRIIFLQDDERGFEPAGDAKFIIEQSFLHYDWAVTAGSWLKDEIARDIKNTFSFDFGVDQIYFPPIYSGKKHLIAFHQPDKPRRLGHLLSAFMLEFHQKYPEWEITVFGSKQFDPKLKFVNQLGVIKPIQIAELYRKGSLGVVFSATNASLVPLEMLSCGLPVITNSGPHSIWLGNKLGLYFSTPEVNSLMKTAEEVIETNVTVSSRIPSWDTQISNFWKNFISALPNGPLASFFAKNES